MDPAIVRAAVLAGVLALTGCASSAPGGDACSVLRPIYVSSQDDLTPDTARQVLANNQTWARLCSTK